MQQRRCDAPTVGALVGWQVYEGTLHTFLAPVLRGIRQAAGDCECNLLLACGVTHASGEAIVPTIRPAWPVLAPDADFVPVGPWNTDGLVVVPPLLADARSQDVRRIIDAGHPVVFAGAGEEGPAVVPDNESGIRQALAHLIGHGHRRVAFVGGTETARDDSAYRLAAFRAAVEEYGLDVDPSLVVCGFHTYGGGQQAIRGLVGAGASFTAVLCSNDESARGVIDALESGGRRVPGDVAVIGFDDRVEARAQEPPLTSVRYPAFEVGYRAVELLLRAIAGEAKDAEIVTVPATLIVRESCGCRPGSVVSSAGNAAGAQPGPAGDERGRLVQAMAAAARLGMLHLGAEEARLLCERLVDAFLPAVEGGDAAGFVLSIGELLRRMEATPDGAYAVQGVITALRDGMEPLLAAFPPESYRRAEDVLHRARLLAGAGGLQQHARHLVRQTVVEDQVGWLAAQLLGAKSEEQIAEVLADHLPEIGIRHVRVAFFAGEDDDPVAWSVPVMAPGAEGVAGRFPSRDFPPAGSYPGEELLSLALLPFAVREGVSGYVAFDAANLDLCAAILRQLASALNSARLYREAVEGRRLAEEADRMKSRFLSMVSHELRTPLNLVVGLADVLLRELAEAGLDLPEQHLRDLERIHSGAQHLDGLVRDVLDLARSEMGRLRLVCEPLDLGEVLHAVVAAGEQLTRAKGLRWQAEVPGDLPRVWGDRTRLRQVALNLVSNAVKFTAKGEVVLKAEVGWAADGKSQIANGRSQIADRQSRIVEGKSPIAARNTQHVLQTPSPESQTGPSASRFTDYATAPDAPVIVVSISDTGLGIPPSEHETIFDEFHQGERTATRGYGGLGLGLTICRRLVEMHGGRIWVESSGEEGGGSAFVFTLPAMDEEVGGEREGEGEGGGAVLVLGERAGGDGHLRGQLERRGFEVDELWVDERPDWLAEVLRFSPSMLVLDFGSAPERGWEVLQALRGNPATRDVPLLFASLEENGHSGAVLAVDTMTKPLGSADLARALERQGLEEGEGKTILVVDDELAMLEMHARIVQAQSPSHRVLTARNGRQALDVMREEKPDLVLLDLMMPELDGFGVLEAIQESETMRGIPVIVLTAQALTAEDMKRLNRGVAAVLGKGLFSVEEIVTRVGAVLARGCGPVGETREVVRRGMSFIHEHYAEPLTRQEIAHHAGVSGGHLGRCFREELGVTPAAYLNRYRVHRARALLAAGDKNVTQVAMAVGFSDAAHFSRTFKREVGVSPSAYRRGER